MHAGSTVANVTGFLLVSWKREGRLRLVSIAAFRHQNPMASGKESDLGKKPESRSETRRGSSLSAEKLERKRANDREAQRVIRQRTKDHIRHLEKQVSKLQSQIESMPPYNERFAEVMRRNAALEDENNRLKQHLASLTGRSFSGTGEQAPYRAWHTDETQGSAIPATGQLLPSHYTGTSHASPALRRATSVLSASSRSSHPHEWEHLSATRSPSHCESSDAQYSNRIDPYSMDGPLHRGSRITPASIPVPTPQMSFSSTASTTQQSSESSFSHIYPVSQTRRGEELDPSSQQQLIDQPQSQYLQPHRSISLPNVTQALQPPPGQAYQPSGQDQHSLATSQQRNLGYTWVPHTS